jgi:hypothetical protein
MVIIISETDDGTKMKTKYEIEKFSRKLPEEIRAELEEIWDKIWMEAINLCPIDTGALASSIKVLEGASETLGGMGGGNVKTVTAGPSLSGELVFDRTIMAGDEIIINPKTGKSTAVYASLVHDGHMMRDGTFWHGVPFLTEAVAKYEGELMAAVDKAIQELSGE